MKYIQYIKWTHVGVTTITYEKPFEQVIDIMKHDSERAGIVGTWLEDEFGKELAYLDGHIQLIRGEEQLKKARKEEILKQVNRSTWVHKSDIKSVLNSLEEKGYIEFKKEPKTHKVFVKIVSISGENKKLYYVTDFHLTENIDEAKRFGLYEEKDGYAYECIKEY